MKGNPKKGLALVMVLLMATVFTLVTFGISSDAISLLQRNFGNTLQRRANYCAYAALQRCLAEMDKTTGFDTTLRFYYTTWNPGVTLTDVPMPGDPESTYTVRVANNSQGLLGSPFVDTDGTKVPVGLVYLKIEAKSSPSPGQYGRTYRNSVASLGFVGQVHWQHAILGTNSVNVTNSWVDSYYSNNTLTYPAGNSSVATVSTNGVQNSLQVLGATTIKGRIRWGPGAVETAACVIDPPPVNITGDRKANNGLYRIPRFKPPFNPVNATTDVILNAGETRTLAPGSYRSAVVPAGAHLVLQSRNYDDPTNTTCTQYYFNDSVNVTGGFIELAALDAPVESSRVEIYVGESVYATAGAQLNPRVNATDSRPSRLELIFVGNGSPRSPQTMTIDNSEVSAVICGPGLNLKVLNNSNLYGAARAFDAVVTNSKVHWDRRITSLDDRIRGQVAWTLKGLVQEGYEGDVDITDAAEYYDGGGGS